MPSLKGSDAFWKSYTAAGCLALLSIVSAVAGVGCFLYAVSSSDRDVNVPAQPTSSDADARTALPAKPTSDDSATTAPVESRATTDKPPHPGAPLHSTEATDKGTEANGERSGGFLDRVRGMAGAVKKRGEETRAAEGGPTEGQYDCFINAGSIQQIFVQKFSIDGDSYKDLSFDQGSGDFSYDSADGSMTFTSGPFEDKYLGVFVGKENTIKTSTRFRYPYTYRPVRSDTIHLLDPKVDYGKKIVFGIYCSRKS